jgi:hypothetical protein
MPAVLRFVRRFLTIASLICFLGVATLWVRSRWAIDSMSIICSRNTPRGWLFVNLGLVSTGDRFNADSTVICTRDPSILRWLKPMPFGPRVVSHSHERLTGFDVEPRRATPRWWNRLGFSYERDRLAPPWESGGTVRFPHWFLLPFFAAMPLLSVWRARTRRRRVREGLCVNCGYDLRASPQRCPECGETPERGMGNLPMHPAAKQHA